MPKLAQRQAVVTVEGITGYWATRSGGNITADVTTVWDGGARQPEMIAAPATAENITLSRPFDSLRDLPLLQSLRSKVGNGRFNISVQFTDENLMPIGNVTSYPQALLVSLNEPEYDASSGDAMTLEVEFAISAWV